MEASSAWVRFRGELASLFSGLMAIVLFSFLNLPGIGMLVVSLSVGLFVAYRVVPWWHKKWDTSTGPSASYRRFLNAIHFALALILILAPLTATMLHIVFQRLPPLLDDEVITTIEDRAFKRRTKGEILSVKATLTSQPQLPYIGLFDTDHFELLPNEIVTRQVLDKTYDSLGRGPLLLALLFALLMLGTLIAMELAGDEHSKPSPPLELG